MQIHGDKYNYKTLDINKNIPQDKLDANNPHQFYTFERKFSFSTKFFTSFFKREIFLFSSSPP